jgi:hypothetical protein
MNPETVQKHRDCISSCTPRIEAERPPQRAKEIIQTLTDLVNSMTEDKEFKFKCSRALYRNPPRMQPGDFQVSMEEMARMEDVIKDKARQALSAEIGYRVERVRTLLVPTDMVCLRAPANAPEPFLIAEVVHNNIQEEKIEIHWFQPSIESKERGNQYHKFNFQQEIVRAGSKARQKNPACANWNFQTQELDYNTIHFGFNKLLWTVGLPATVLRELRELGLVKGPIRRNN